MGTDFSKYSSITHGEKNAIQTSWKEIRKDLNNFGNKLLSHIFNEYSSIANYFPFTHEQKDLFWTHSKKFVKDLDQMIEHLDKPEYLKKILISNSKAHSPFLIAMEDYVKMKKAIVETISAELGPNFTSVERNAWDKTLMLAFEYIESVSAETRGGKKVVHDTN